MRRGSSKIEERVCIDALVQYVKGVGAISVIEAQAEADDPPDYWLDVGVDRFAVEITSIVKDHGYDALCNAVHRSIKAEIESDDSVSGMYAVEFFRYPEIPKKWTSERRKLIADAVTKIRGLAGSEPDSESRIFQDKSGHITVSKWSAEGNTVGMCRIPEAKYEGDAQVELSLLLEQAIGKKFQKLQKKGVMAVCPDVILLLYDAYGYGSIETAKSALSNIKGYEWLHSIFWTASFSDRPNVMYPDSPGRAGGFLYSKSEDWLQREE
ncbi:MAG: hypothetical protein HGB23_11645 [Chlorobiaceae bacterium]|nr:hypothetical protein [Chlorobiaceae bacterium]